jgi:hypothetical protein
MCFLADDRYKDAWCLRKKHAQIRLLGAKTYAAGANFEQCTQTTGLLVQRYVPQVRHESKLHRSHSVAAAEMNIEEKIAWQSIHRLYLYITV